MRVLLTSPYGWPEVRRGAERELHELAARLRDAGDDPRVLTGTAQGVTRRGRELGVPVRRVRPVRRAGWPEPGPGWGLVARAGATLGRPDVVHALHYADAWGASHGRAPVVLKLTGTVLPERTSGWDERLLRGALERAAEVWVNSDYAREAMAGWGVPMRVVPAGVDTALFAPAAARAAEPLVVCAAAGEDPRKRLVDLLAAWPAVRAALPGARLVLAGAGPDPGLPGVTRAAGLDDRALAALYARAWAVAAPAVHEALGLVTLEALACGTPVAGALSGATASLVTPGVTGELHAPADPDDLARAVVAAATLGSAGPVAACRSSVAGYAWGTVVERVREGHRRVLAARA